MLNLEDSDDNSSVLNTHHVKGHSFLLPPIYTNLTYIGEGAYGVVVSAYDSILQHDIAIKKLSPFEHYMCSMRALREIKFLCSFDHENIIPVLDIVTNKTNGQRYNDIYLIFEKMETDLARVLKDQELKTEHICYFTYQIVRGLKYLHSANIAHRDLKPSNLLINSNCDLKICDFGLARVSLPTNVYSAIMTEYVATRWYRAPEIMLSSRCYGLAIDIWSVGCILGEMLHGRPLFQGQHYIHQLELILKFVGTPSPEDMKIVHNEKARMFLNKQPKYKKINFQIAFPNANYKELDLLDRCLTFSPVRRYTVSQCISHPYLEEYHDSEDEPTYPKQFQINEDVGEDIARENLVGLIHKEIQQFTHK